MLSVNFVPGFVNYYIRWDYFHLPHNCIGILWAVSLIYMEVEGKQHLVNSCVIIVCRLSFMLQ